MSFRTVIIRNRCKLEYSMNFMIVRKGNEESKILIDEIKLLLIESTQTCITSCLISELVKSKVKIIFSDEKHNPIGELTPYQNNFYSYRKIKEQLSFNEEQKRVLWNYIIKEKINNHARNLKYANKIKEYEQLLKYRDEVVDGDTTNREGHAAKVYFNALFGTSFNRNSEDIINVYLNYGYTVLLSSINREIKGLGYLTELGIHHIGESNSFNLSCDFIEPIRPLVDSYIIKGMLNEDNFRDVYIGMLGTTVSYNNKKIFLDNAIYLYVEDLILYLKTADLSRIKFIQYEL